MLLFVPAYIIFAYCVAHYVQSIIVDTRSDFIVSKQRYLSRSSLLESHSINSAALTA